MIFWTLPKLENEIYTKPDFGSLVVLPYEVRKPNSNFKMFFQISLRCFSLSISLSHCVASSLCTGSWCTFISIQQHGTSLLLPSTFMHTTCQMFVWVCSPSVAPLSPGLYYLCDTRESSLVCGNTDSPPLKTNKYDGSAFSFANNLQPMLSHTWVPPL